jgi:hypothetical protein
MPAALIFAAPVIAGALSRMDPMLPAKVGGAILAAGAGVIAGSAIGRELDKPKTGSLPGQPGVTTPPPAVPWSTPDYSGWGALHRTTAATQEIGATATADSMYTNMPSTPFPAWPMNSTPPIDGVRRNMYQPQPPANRQVQNQEKPTDPTSGTQRGNCKGPAQVRRYTRAGFLTRATPISPETPTP